MLWEYSFLYISGDISNEGIVPPFKPVLAECFNHIFQIENFLQDAGLE